MSRGAVRSLLAVAGLATVAVVSTPVMAQAPASAQNWTVQFVADTSGPFAASESTTAVRITMLARVTISPNASATGTNNFGVSRVGGGNGTFFANFSDPAGGPFASTAGPAPTGEAGLDAGGQPLAGHFAAFRGGFAPQGTGGFNNDSANGIYSTVGGNARVTSIVGSRAIGNDGTILGVSDFVAVYSFMFFPKPATSRSITLNVTGISGRYLQSLSGGGFATAAPAVNLPDQSITFRVPAPGAAALMGLSGLVALRRRRA